MASLEQLFGSELLAKADGSKTSTQSLAECDLIGVYFSAHWCPPCRGFTPQLASCYNAIKAAGKKFEIIFVSFDRDEAAFKEYFGEMPWVSLPFDSDKKEKLSEDYGVSGIPALILLNRDGSMKTTDGRQLVASDLNGEKFPWN
ncbi:nucleoredoxin-like [Plakobranchus ocellatus]|uniref:Nucleoredoxin-like n=1 Tax=Plakobranchus ocellatus TaxID=259542 RepID=A0AAV4E1B2_9GAST|nr:nucleoredoxin-like [Plakobranchus ocellatus]